MSGISCFGNFSMGELGEVANLNLNIDDFIGGFQKTTIAELGRCQIPGFNPPTISEFSIPPIPIFGGIPAFPLLCGLPPFPGIPGLSLPGISIPIPPIPFLPPIPLPLPIFSLPFLPTLPSFDLGSISFLCGLINIDLPILDPFAEVNQFINRLNGFLDAFNSFLNYCKNNAETINATEIYPEISASSFVSTPISTPSFQAGQVGTANFKPNISIIGVGIDEEELTNSTVVSFIIQFSESVTGFDTEQIQTNKKGRLTLETNANVKISSSFRVKYEALEEGLHTLKVLGVAKNLAGLQASDSREFRFAIKTTRPSIVRLSLFDEEGSSIENQTTSTLPIIVEALFDESVEFTPDLKSKIQHTTGFISNVQTVPQDLTNTFPILRFEYVPFVRDNLNPLPISIKILEDIAKDAYGNSSQPSREVTTSVQTVKPIVVIEEPEELAKTSPLTNLARLRFKATVFQPIGELTDPIDGYLDAYGGFVEDISIQDGYWIEEDGYATDEYYNTQIAFTFVADEDGSKSIRILEGLGTNQAGSPSLESNSIRWTLDRVPPQISLEGLSSDGYFEEIAYFDSSELEYFYSPEKLTITQSFVFLDIYSSKSIIFDDSDIITNDGYISTTLVRSPLAHSQYDDNTELRKEYTIVANLIASESGNKNIQIKEGAIRDQIGNTVTLPLEYKFKYLKQDESLDSSQQLKELLSNNQGQGSIPTKVDQDKTITTNLVRETDKPTKCEEIKITSTEADDQLDILNTLIFAEDEPAVNLAVYAANAGAIPYEQVGELARALSVYDRAGDLSPCSLLALIIDNNISHPKTFIGFKSTDLVGFHPFSSTQQLINDLIANNLIQDNGNIKQAIFDGLKGVSLQDQTPISLAILLNNKGIPYGPLASVLLRITADDIARGFFINPMSQLVTPKNIIDALVRVGVIDSRNTNYQLALNSIQPTPKPLTPTLLADSFAKVIPGPSVGTLKGMCIAKSEGLTKNSLVEIELARKAALLNSIGNPKSKNLVQKIKLLDINKFKKILTNYNVLFPISIYEIVPLLSIELDIDDKAFYDMFSYFNFAPLFEDPSSLFSTLTFMSTTLTSSSSALLQIQNCEALQEEDFIYSSWISQIALALNKYQITDFTNAKQIANALKVELNFDYKRTLEVLSPSTLENIEELAFLMLMTRRTTKSFQHSVESTSISSNFLASSKLKSPITISINSPTKNSGDIVISSVDITLNKVRSLTTGSTRSQISLVANGEPTSGVTASFSTDDILGTLDIIISAIADFDQNYDAIESIVVQAKYQTLMGSSANTIPSHLILIGK